MYELLPSIWTALPEIFSFSKFLDPRHSDQVSRDVKYPAMFYLRRCIVFTPESIYVDYDE